VISSIPFDKNVYKSLTIGSPIFLSNPRSKASREFLKIAYWLLGEKQKKRGFTKILQRFSIKNIFRNLN